MVSVRSLTFFLLLSLSLLHIDIWAETLLPTFGSMGSLDSSSLHSISLDSVGSCPLDESDELADAISAQPVFNIAKNIRFQECETKETTAQVCECARGNGYVLEFSKSQEFLLEIKRKAFLKRSLNSLSNLREKIESSLKIYHRFDFDLPESCLELALDDKESGGSFCSDNSYDRLVSELDNLPDDHYIIKQLNLKSSRLDKKLVLSKLMSPFKLPKNKPLEFSDLEDDDLDLMLKLISEEFKTIKVGESISLSPSTLKKVVTEYIKENNLSAKEKKVLNLKMGSIIDAALLLSDLLNELKVVDDLNLSIKKNITSPEKVLNQFFGQFFSDYVSDGAVTLDRQCKKLKKLQEKTCLVADGSDKEMKHSRLKREDLKKYGEAHPNKIIYSTFVCQLTYLTSFDSTKRVKNEAEALDLYFRKKEKRIDLDIKKAKNYKIAFPTMSIPFSDEKHQRNMIAKSKTEEEIAKERKIRAQVLDKLRKKQAYAKERMKKEKRAKSEMKMRIRKESSTAFDTPYVSEGLGVGEANRWTEKVAKSTKTKMKPKPAPMARPVNTDVSVKVKKKPTAKSTSAKSPIEERIARERVHDPKKEELSNDIERISYNAINNALRPSSRSALLAQVSQVDRKKTLLGSLISVFEDKSEVVTDAITTGNLPRKNIKAVVDQNKKNQNIASISPGKKNSKKSIRKNKSGKKRKIEKAEGISLESEKDDTDIEAKNIDKVKTTGRPSTPAQFMNPNTTSYFGGGYPSASTKARSKVKNNNSNKEKNNTTIRSNQNYFDKFKNQEVIHSVREREVITDQTKQELDNKISNFRNEQKENNLNSNLGKKISYLWPSKKNITEEKVKAKIKDFLGDGISSASGKNINKSKQASGRVSYDNKKENESKYRGYINTSNIKDYSSKIEGQGPKSEDAIRSPSSPIGALSGNTDENNDIKMYPPKYYLEGSRFETLEDHDLFSVSENGLIIVIRTKKVNRVEVDFIEIFQINSTLNGLEKELISSIPISRAKQTDQNSKAIKEYFSRKRIPQ